MAPGAKEPATASPAEPLASPNASTVILLDDPAARLSNFSSNRGGANANCPTGLPSCLEAPLNGKWPKKTLHSSRESDLVV